MGVTGPPSEAGSADSGRDSEEVEGRRASTVAAATTSEGRAGGAEMRNSENILKFAPAQSAVDEGFWHRMASYKLETQRLEEHPIAVTGISLYFLNESATAGIELSSLLQCH
jgi:hypothetical protein